jgi:uncharacterized membrane protein
MSALTWGMTGAGAVSLVAGMALARPRLRSVSGADKVLALGPVFEAVALTMFAAEHFLAAQDLKSIVPHWLPWPLFWTYFFGVALLAAAISLIAWLCVRWSAALLTLFFLIIVAVVDLPDLRGHIHERLFWTLTVRELLFACGAMVLAGSMWAGRSLIATTLKESGRVIVGLALIFYAIQHFIFPRFAPGVPLEKMTPAWVPTPVLLAYFSGATLLVAGAALLARRWVRGAVAGAGVVMLFLTVFLYGPIMVMEFHTTLAVEGINYVGDTLLFAATILLAGRSVPRAAAQP